MEHFKNYENVWRKVYERYINRHYAQESEKKRVEVSQRVK